MKGPGRPALRMRALAAGLVLALLMTAGCSDKGGDDGDGDADAGANGSVSGGAGAGAGASGSGSQSSGGGTGGAGGGAGASQQEVTLEVATSGVYPANPGFDPATASVPSGALVHATFTNADPAALVVQHNWVVEGIEGASSDSIGQGEESSFDFTAPAPGEYAFYCSIGDHRDRGMEGTLTVTA